MEESPLDELNVQLPGRALVAEILLTLLLQTHPDAPQILKAADERVSQLEAAILEQEALTDYAIKMFASARETLDEFVRNVGPRHG